ncbi:unnamed protein product [Lactuca saligna]|nr:unnamed protein product [Lactuca saligna]
MACPLNANEASSIIVDVHYEGIFSPKPLVYFQHIKASIRDVDFGGIEFKEFISVFEKITKRKCTDVYYYLGHKSLRDELRPLTYDDDYTRFLDDANGNGGRLVYTLITRTNLYLNGLRKRKQKKVLIVKALMKIQIQSFLMLYLLILNPIKR